MFSVSMNFCLPYWKSQGILCSIRSGLAAAAAAADDDDAIMQVVPSSCCAMRHRDSLPVPDNPSQCQLDARQNVVSSVFLNTQVSHHADQEWSLICVRQRMCSL